MLKKISPFHFNIADPGIPEPTRRSMQYAMWESAFTGITGSLTGGVVLTGFALALGANSFIIGLIASIQVGANLLQVRAYRSLEEKGQRKAMAVKFAAAARLLWIPICGLVFINFEAFAAYRLWFFLLLIAVASGLGVFSLVPWVSWLVDLVPEKMRGRFLAQRSLAGGVVGVIVGVAAGKFIDLWNAQQWGPAPYGFAVLIAGGIVCGVWSAAMMNKMHDPVFAKPATPSSFWQSVRTPFYDPNFRRLFYFRISYDFSMGIVGAFYGVYMLKQAGLSFTFVSSMTMLATFTNLLALKPWGKFLDKFGNKPTLYLCMIGKTVFAFFWIFTTPETFGLYILLHLFGVFDAGNTLAIPNLIYKLAPPERRANYIAVDGTVVGVVATMAPLLGGGLALVFSKWNLTWGNFQWTQFHFLFLLATLLRLLTFWTLRQVREPESKSVAQVFRMIPLMRSIDISEGFEEALHFLLAPARFVMEKFSDRPPRRSKSNRTLKKPPNSPMGPSRESGNP